MNHLANNDREIKTSSFDNNFRNYFQAPFFVEVRAKWTTQMILMKQYCKK